MLSTIIAQSVVSVNIWTILIPILSAAFGAAAAIGTTLITQSGSFRRDYLKRLEKVEKENSRLKNIIFRLKTAMSSIVLEHELMLKLCPEGSDEIEKFRKRTGSKSTIIQFKELLDEEDFTKISENSDSEE